MHHKIAFIGAGDVVRKNYVPILLARDDCEVAGIVSQYGVSARDLAVRHGISTAYQKYEDLLENPAIDTVFICTPPYLHRQIAVMAIERNKNVFVEKPLCTSYQDSHSLLRRAGEYSKTFYIAFNNQFREENQWLRDQVINGRVGDLDLIDLEWYRTRRYEHKSWLYDPVLSGGGALIDLGSHMIHFALSLIPQRARFVVFCKNLSHEWQSLVESTSISMITVVEKITISLKVGWDMKLPSPSHVLLRVHGNRASLSSQAYEGSKTDGFGRMVDDFFSHVKAGTRQDLGLVEDTVLLLSALYESNRSQSTICGEFGVLA